MKKSNHFLRTYAVAIAAILVAIGTMSFRYMEKQNNLRAGSWYAVAEDGQTINPTPLDEPPADCQASEGPHCSLQMTLNPGVSVPSTVNQAFSQEAANQLTIDAERFREK